MVSTTTSLWKKCPDCEEWWCRAHGEHAADCECLDVEALLEQGIDPYLPGSLGKYLLKYPPPRRMYEP